MFSYFIGFILVLKIEFSFLRKMDFIARFVDSNNMSICFEFQKLIWHVRVMNNWQNIRKSKKKKIIVQPIKIHRGGFRGRIIFSGEIYFAINSNLFDFNNIPKIYFAIYSIRSTIVCTQSVTVVNPDTHLVHDDETVG